MQDILLHVLYSNRLYESSIYNVFLLKQHILYSTKYIYVLKIPYCSISYKASTIILKTYMLKTNNLSICVYNVTRRSIKSSQTRESTSAAQPLTPSEIRSVFVGSSWSVGGIKGLNNHHGQNGHQSCARKAHSFCR